MTDEQIIEQWEKVLAIGDAPIGEHWSVGGIVTTQLAKETLDALNRQKETIQSQDEMIRALINAQETLQKESNTIKKSLEHEINSHLKNILELRDKLARVKSVAIKEFAERLREKSSLAGSILVGNKVFDNLVKEMVR